MTDPILDRLCAALQARSEVGIAKYGTTLARTDIDLRGWLQHALEEACDLALYLTRATAEIEMQEVAADRINLALTILRADLERPGVRDTAALRRVYVLLGGVGATDRETAA